MKARQTSKGNQTTLWHRLGGGEKNQVMGEKWGGKKSRSPTQRNRKKENFKKGEKERKESPKTLGPCFRHHHEGVAKKGGEGGR